MAQTQKLEQVLDLLLAEDQDTAAQMLHQIIVEKARDIYESIVEQEESVVGSEDDTEDFTAQISDHEADIESDHENDGEVSDDEGEDGDDEGEDDGEVEDRVEDLEAQLAELRAEFDALMAEELEEPNHADLASDAEKDEQDGDKDDLDAEDPAEMFERSVSPSLKVAPRATDARHSKQVAEETQFLTKVADTGQRGTAKLVGTGNKSSLGAEQNQSPYTKAPAKKEYGGTPVKMGSGSGGEYGKYTGETPKELTDTDNTGIEPKKVSAKADAVSRYTGGKPAGDGESKSPLSKRP